MEPTLASSRWLVSVDEQAGRCHLTQSGQSAVSDQAPCRRAPRGSANTARISRSQASLHPFDVIREAEDRVSKPVANTP